MINNIYAVTLADRQTGRVFQTTNPDARSRAGVFLQAR
jgi:hypothetical protein